MNWTDLIWLLLGLGLGVGLRWVRPRSSASPVEATPAAAEPIALDDRHEQLQQLQLAYQLASEMSQFKGGFMARVSHELRSPLNGLIGLHQLILSDLCDSPEEEREFVAQAHQAALKMVKILDNILDVARVQHGTLNLHIQPVSLLDMFQALESLTQLPARDRNLQLQITLPDADLYVLADPQRLRQVLLHLVDTAIRSMAEGRIAVTAHPSVATGVAQIWIDSDCVLVTHREPIDLLQSAPAQDAVSPSPGLNLLTTQILVQQMQGKLEALDVVSEPAPHTRLQCSLPMLSADALAVAAEN